MEASHLQIPHRLPSRLLPHRAEHPETWPTQLRWSAGAVVLSFVVPFIFSSVLGLQHDVDLALVDDG